MPRAAKLLRAIPGFISVVMLCQGGVALAQQPPTREGFWGALGLGYGANSMSCSGGCAFTPDAKGGAVTASVKMGGTPKSNLRLGGEVNVWVKNVGGVTETVGNISGAAYFYPAPRSGFFVKGGLGLASFQLTQGNSSISADGLGLLTGVGYDVRLSQKVSLTPVVNVYVGNDGDLKSGSTLVIPGIRHTIVDFGLSVQYN